VDPTLAATDVYGEESPNSRIVGHPEVTHSHGFPKWDSNHARILGLLQPLGKSFPLRSTLAHAKIKGLNRFLHPSYA
jgi:hypothetical protein